MQAVTLSDNNENKLEIEYKIKEEHFQAKFLASKFLFKSHLPVGWILFWEGLSSMKWYILFNNYSLFLFLARFIFLIKQIIHCSAELFISSHRQNEEKNQD